MYFFKLKSRVCVCKKCERSNNWFIVYLFSFSDAARNIEAETHFEGKKFNSPRSENEVRHGREDSDPG